MSRLAGKGQPLLYLDFDGVLHHEDVWRHPKKGVYFGPLGQGHEFFEHAKQLCTVLAPYPRVQIILSTSWVRMLGYDRASKQLPKELQARIIGATHHSGMPRDDFVSMRRGGQVLADVRRRQPSAWVALDDDAEGPAGYQDHLVQTDPAMGLLGEGVIEKLETHLRRISEASL
jgi:hypothetical protein